MTLREFLLQNAPRDEIERRRAQQDWITAVDKLLADLRAWLEAAGSADLLDLEQLEFHRREQGLGSYRVNGLAIHFGEHVVRIEPVGRRVLADLGPYAEAGFRNAEGRVDITNGVDKIHLYRKLTPTVDQWLVKEERSALRPLDPAAFEAILQDLLS
jgi:hypothetical protein